MKMLHLKWELMAHTTFHNLLLVFLWPKQPSISCYYYMQTLAETNQQGEEKNIVKNITLFFNNLIAIYNHKTQVESNKEEQVLQLVRKEQNST